MRRFRAQEWFWLGVIGVAFLIMIGMTVAPWLAR